MLDQQLHPIPPDNTCPQSVQIFEEHKQVPEFKFYYFLKLYKLHKFSSGNYIIVLKLLEIMQFVNKLFQF